MTGLTGWGLARAPGTDTPPRQPNRPGQSAGASPAPCPCPPSEVEGNPAGPAPDQAQSHPWGVDCHEGGKYNSVPTLSTAGLHSCPPLGSAAEPARSNYRNLSSSSADPHLCVNHENVFQQSNVKYLRRHSLTGLPHSSHFKINNSSNIQKANMKTWNCRNIF